ncbi:PIN domain-containing protein [Neoroseomonas rubea]|uniref:PIN domain-containing protein n=1 Tax=Neoroseomonas rubea TaxID=2748666 RepID=UPI0018DF071E|nr:hypothetical protein [Roseomonas rubea]
MVPAQAVGGLFVMLTRKAKREAAEARSAVLGWSDSFPLIDTTPGVILEAKELVTTHRLGFWASLMLAGAAQAGCRMLRSEDMQDGFTWRGVTVRRCRCSAGRRRWRSRSGRCGGRKGRLDLNDSRSRLTSTYAQGSETPRFLRSKSGASCGLDPPRSTHEPPAKPAPQRGAPFGRGKF